MNETMGHKTFLPTLVLVLLALVLTVVRATAHGPAEGKEAPSVALGTGFTYQGQLKQNGSNITSSCNFRFSLWDSLNNATGQLGSTQTINGVSLSNGMFTVTLNGGSEFGANAFIGDARWLRIETQCAGDGGFTALNPRQPLTPTPLALALPGLFTQQNATSPNIVGGFNGNSVSPGVVGATISGGGLSGSIHSVTADYGTIGGGEGNTASNQYATVGGGETNTASGNAATIGGGTTNSASNQYATVGGGYDNAAIGILATVGGGNGNIARGPNATIGGGGGNTASGAFGYAAVGGGYQNTANGGDATVGGGYQNTANGGDATVGGGSYNTAIGDYVTVGGGYQNSVSGGAAIVGGGYHNTASGGDATVSGGYQNTASGGDAIVGGGSYNTAIGDDATVPGGFANLAQGTSSFAAGQRAEALYPGSFVWNDSVAAGSPFSDSKANEFNIRASGGVRIFSSSDYTTGCFLAAGAMTWNCTSDRKAKENFAAVENRDILTRLAAVPIQTWNSKMQDPAIRHIGPMAQDFYAAFKLGEDDKHISTGDADGVALAAIQALYQIAQEKDAEIQNLKAQNAKSQNEIGDLKTRMTALEQALSKGTPTKTNGVMVRAEDVAIPLNWLLFGGFIAASFIFARRRA